MRFEWDAEKAAQNLAKHGVSFAEASTVFDDPLSVTVSDPRHSWREECLVLFGVSRRGRLLAVFHDVAERFPTSESVNDALRRLAGRGGS
jgi:uncharacterized DUF497 family protein